MKVLVVDVGGTGVKLLASGEQTPRKFPSGPKMTPRMMVHGVQELCADWKYTAIAMGYPGQVHGGKIVTEPHNLAAGWVGFDFARAFGHPVKLINDAAMQALGSYQGKTMLFLGLGTGLGSALVVEGNLVPLELAHLPYKHATIEDYVGQRGIKRYGKKKWREHVDHCVEQLIAAFNPDDVVLGGGNVKNLKRLPARCRLGNNENAFIGGFRLWELPSAAARKKTALPVGPKVPRKILRTGPRKAAAR